MKLKNSNCDLIKTQIVITSKTQTVMKFKNSNNDENENGDKTQEPKW